NALNFCTRFHSNKSIVNLVYRHIVNLCNPSTRSKRYATKTSQTDSTHICETPLKLRVSTIFHSEMYHNTDVKFTSFHVTEKNFPKLTYCGKVSPIDNTLRKPLKPKSLKHLFYCVDISD